MLRRLWNLALFLSLLLCVAATVIWTFGIQGVAGFGRDPRVLFELLPNRVAGAIESPRTVPSDVVNLPSLAAHGRIYRFAGFEYHCGEESHYVDLGAIGLRSFVHEYHAANRVVVPYWAVIAITATIVLLGIRSWRAEIRTKARSAAGECVHCGYDLRATPGRCPECGAPVTQKVWADA